MHGVLVDSGNVLFSPKSAKGIKPEDTVNAEGIAEIYRQMNYAGVSIGRYDLAAGLDFLKYLEQQGFPVLCANLTADDELVFEPYKSIEIGTVRIGLVGLTSAPATESYQVLNPVEVLDRLLPELEASHDLIVLLFNGPDRSAKALADKYPTIGVIIGADPRKANMGPLLINGSLLTQVDSQGKYLGALFVEWRDAPWKEDFVAELEELERSLENEKWQLERLAAAPNQSSVRHERKRSVAMNKISMLEKKIERIHARQSSIPAHLPTSSYRSEFIALKPSTPLDSRIEAQVRALKSKVDLARMSARQP